MHLVPHVVLTLVESPDALMLDGLGHAVHGAFVHRGLPGGRLGHGLEANLKEERGCVSSTECCKLWQMYGLTCGTHKSPSQNPPCRYLAAAVD